MNLESHLTTRLAFPGDLQTRSGGYAYARRILKEIPEFGIALDPLPLSGGFPHPGKADIDRALRALAETPKGAPILLDGLAGGAFPAGSLAGLIERSGVRIVMLCHHPLAFEIGLSPERADELHANERASLAAVHHVVVTSRTTADALRSSYGVAPERLTIAYPGTDIPPEPTAARSGSESEESRPVRILSVGSISPRKGHHLLIEALRPFAGLSWRLDIAGPVQDRQYEGALKRKIDEAGLSERVRFLGAQAPEDLEVAYAAADIFALASQYEGFGMAFTEAMARGLPVLGCPCGAVPEATQGAAELVAPDNLGTALSALITDPNRRSKLAERCLRASRGFQRWPETARIVADVLHRAVQ